MPDIDADYFVPAVLYRIDADYSVPAVLCRIDPDSSVPAVLYRIDRFLCTGCSVPDINPDSSVPAVLRGYLYWIFYHKCPHVRR